MNTISAIALLEVRSALQRRLRLGQLTADAVQHAEFELRVGSQSFTHWPIQTSILEHASVLIQRHALRALDALQLASSLAVRDDLEPGDHLIFIGSDVRLLAAAQSEGLATWDPANAAHQPAPPVN